MVRWIDRKTEVQVNKHEHIDPDVDVHSYRESSSEHKHTTDTNTVDNKSSEHKCRRLCARKTAFRRSCPTTSH